MPSAAQSVDEGLRRQAEREKSQREAAQTRSDDLHADWRSEELPTLPTEQPCFVIDTFALDGRDATRFRWLADTLMPLTGQCIGTQGISRLAAFLDNQLIEQGFVTSRVSLGPQNLSSKRLVFRLSTGRISQVRMVGPQQRDATGNSSTDAAQASDWGTWKNAFPTGAGDLLNARDLEQGVEQMKRLPSQTVTTVLEPGDEPDTSILVIERSEGSLRDRIRGSVTLDNSGSPALGRTQASLNVALDNPLGVNDLISVGVNTNAESPTANHRSQSYFLGYSVPWGYVTFSANVSQSRFAQIVQLPSLPHLSSGKANTVELGLDLIALRTASAKLGLYSKVSTRKSSSYLDDVELLQQRRQTTSFESGVNLKKLFASGATVDASVGYRRGVQWLDAQSDFTLDPSDPTAVPTLRPQIWLAEGSAVVPFTLGELAEGRPRPWQFSVSVRGQYTHDHTLTIDQIAIGNRATVRGFDGDSVLLAESGWYVRNELSTPLAVGEVQGSAYAGIDYGRVWGSSSALLPGRALSGVALGWRAQYRFAQFDLAVATPLGKPHGLLSQQPAVYGSASLVF